MSDEIALIARVANATLQEHGPGVESNITFFRDAVLQVRELEAGRE